MYYSVYSRLNLAFYIKNDCPELAQSAPLALIIQPQSKGTFQLAFESDYVQTFQRSISYRINYSYRHHIIILAEGKLPSVRLNKSHLILTQLAGVQPEVCYRAKVTVQNPFNTLIEFKWIPIYGEQGIAFSVRPASGIIEPYRSLDCEVVWHGSALAPAKGTFSLQVTGGEATTLHCEAKIGSSQIQFLSRRANFGKISVNMKTTRTFFLTNNGSQNAYFQILDTRPIQGMVITPMFGLAPVNALTPIKIEMSPTETVKFDARVLIQVRGGRQLELRLSGESEEPMFDFDLPSFDFGGIFTGASCAIPFKMTNKTQVKGKIEFNLKKFPDFSLRSKEKSTQLSCNENRLYELLVQGSQAVTLELVFSPSGVASYDFDLPMCINKPEEINLAAYDHMIANTPFLSGSLSLSMREKATQSAAQYSRSRFSANLDQTPRMKVLAVGLRKALVFSASVVHFQVPIRYYEKLKEGGFFEVKSVVMTNHSHRPVKWCIDMRHVNKVLEDGIFKICDGQMIPFVNSDKKSYGPEGEIKQNESYEIKILFCPDRPGIYSCNLPIAINSNYEQPYYNIEVTGELLTPEIYFEPDVLVFRPVPLGLEASELVFIKQKGYENKSKLRLEIPEIKTIDGDVVNVLMAEFANEAAILPNENHQIEVNLKFRSPKPISTTVKLKFIDEQDRAYYFNVLVTADNSLLTCYGFLADHHANYHIVLEQGQVMKGTRTNQSLNGSENSGEPILRPYSGTSRQSRSYSISPTFDLQNSLNESQKDNEEAIHAAIIGDGSSPATLSRMESRMSTAFAKALEPLLYPTAESNLGLYTNQVLRALERWFKCNGWPTGQNLVKIPESFRSGVSRKPLDENQENMPQQDAMKRETKTIYEMLQFLSGRQLPAIPVQNPVPIDLVERAVQFQWQHNVLIKFLESGGACMSHIRPDYLLDGGEFKTWLDQIDKKRDLEESSTGYKNTLIECLDSPRVTASIFPLVSRKAWLDCLLQTLKVCVLNRITPKLFKSMAVPFSSGATFPDVKSDPLTSNIYSIGERILLAWLNYCYANFKDKIWPVTNNSGQHGTPPPSRWIVNFDVDLTDSLALAAAIGAYCPYIVDSHLSRMYLSADTAEKCFHNALILVECCRELGFDYDITSLDITDPNAIAMLLLVAYLFNKLPNYVPSATIEFAGPLHTAVSKQIKISNPISKNIFYEALIIGPNRENFFLSKGKELTISSRGRANLTVDFSSDNLKPAVAYLILAGRKNGSVAADPLVFNLKANVIELTAKKVVKFQSALYKQRESNIEIENPYEHAGEFKVAILETGEKSESMPNPFNDEAIVMSSKTMTTTVSNVNSKKLTVKKSIENPKALKNP